VRNSMTAPGLLRTVLNVVSENLVYRASELRETAFESFPSRLQLGSGPKPAAVARDKQLKLLPTSRPRNSSSILHLPGRIR
jgi:hypothetical protein